MFGDSQLPPMPKQVASATQPTEARSPGPSAGGGGHADEDAPLASAATPGAVSAARASIEQSAAAMAVGAVVANGVTAGSAPPPQLLQPAVVSASVETQSTVPNASFSTQTEVLAAVPSSSFAVQTEPEPAPMAVASASTGIQHSTPSTSLATQTEAAPALPPPPPTSSAATQTAAPPAVASTSTATDAEIAPVMPAAAAGAVAGLAAGGAAGAASRSLGVDVAPVSSQPPPVSAFASPAAGEQLAGALESPSASILSESVTGDGAPASSATARSAAPASAPVPTTASQRYVNKLGEELERVMQGEWMCQPANRKAFPLCIPCAR